MRSWTAPVCVVVLRQLTVPGCVMARQNLIVLVPVTAMQPTKMVVAAHLVSGIAGVCNGNAVVDCAVCAVAMRSQTVPVLVTALQRTKMVVAAHLVSGIAGACVTVTPLLIAPVCAVATRLWTVQAPAVGQPR